MAVGLAATVVTSCAMPAFDLKLILAHEARQKMTEVMVHPDINGSFGDIDSIEGLFYVPSRMTTPDHGLLVRRHSLGYEARYVRYDPVAQGFRADFYQDWRFYNDEPENQYPVIVPVIDTGPGPHDDLYFVAMPDRNESDIRHATYVYDITTSSFTEAASPSTPPELDAAAVALDITGQGAFPRLRVIHEGATASELDIVAEQFVDGESEPATRYDPGSVTLPAGAEAAAGRLAYEFDTDTYVYSYSTDGESFVAYSWVGTGTPAKLASDRRIDEILETGDLYSRGESTDVIYDASGKTKHELRVGALYFSHERLEPNGSVLVYSLVHRAATNDARVSIGVYEIALSNVGSLE